MIIFENDGEIDIRLAMLIGVNVKETSSPIGFFGTGLKYAIACLSRWGEEIRIQSGVNEFSFSSEDTEIRGKQFGILTLRGPRDSAPLGFTTDLGKRWEPWMVYRELWCNAHDEPRPNVYEDDAAPPPKSGMTRVIVTGDKMNEAHASRHTFILGDRSEPLHKLPGVEIYEGEGSRIFYRGIAVQNLHKPSLYTYNITESLYLTEDRTAGGWQTDPIIARGLSSIGDTRVIDATLRAPTGSMESRLDYDDARDPSEEWLERAHVAVENHPLDVPSSVRGKFVHHEVSTCPACGRSFSE